MAITNASTLAEYASGISTQGATLTVDANNKRVGIGTTNPLAMLQVGTGVTVFGNAGIASFTSLKLSGDTDSTSVSTGALTVTGGVGIGLSLTVGGDVSVGGTITYEDVTNVDSLGIVTARSGLRVVGGGITCVGVATFFNNIRAENSVNIVGGGLTCLGIGTFFNDVTVGAGNSVGIGSDDPAVHLDILNTSANANIKLKSAANSFNTFIFDTNRTSANDNLSLIDARWNGTVVSRIQFKTGSDTTNKDDGWIAFHTRESGSALAERLCIDASGDVILGGSSDAGYANYADNLTIHGTGNEGITIRSGASSQGAIYFSDATGSGTGTYEGNIIYDHNVNALIFGSNHTERARIDSSGRLLIGTSDVDPVSDGEVSKLIIKGTDSTASASFTRHSADSGGTGLYLGKSRNATIGSNTIVQSGDELGRITFSGDDGTNINTMGAKIAAYVDGTPGENDMPGRLVFYTTADGAASVSERMRIRQNGQVVINKSDGAYLELTRTSTNTSGVCGKITFGNTDWDSSMASIQSYQDGANDNASLRFYTQPSGGAETERLRIDSSGNITAVNTTSGGTTGVTLKVGASASSGTNSGTVIVNNGGTGDASLQFDYESSAARARIWVYRSDNILRFDTGGTERLRINGSGQIGINTTTIVTGNNFVTLHLGGKQGAGGQAGQGNMLIGDTYSSGNKHPKNCQLTLGGTHNDTAYNADGQVKLYITGSDNDSGVNYPVYCEDENANVLFTARCNGSAFGFGIGTDAPDQKLHVKEPNTNSSAWVKIENNRARNAGILCTTTSGSWYAGTGIGVDADRFSVYDTAERLTVTDSEVNVTNTLNWNLMKQTTVTTTLSSGLSDGAWQTVISPGVLSHQGLYFISIFWNYNGQGGAPYYAQGGFMFMGNACNDNSGDITNNIEDLVTSCHVGGDYYLSVRSLTESSGTNGIQARINGWTASSNSEFIVKYKRVW